jgi:hypothetical protein
MDIIHIIYHILSIYIKINYHKRLILLNQIGMSVFAYRAYRPIYYNIYTHSYIVIIREINAKIRLYFL